MINPAHTAAMARTTVTLNRADAAKAAAAEGTGYVVAEGRSLSTPRGIVSEGQVIGPLDFETQAAFEERLEAGLVVPAGEQ